ncbi:MAG: phosphatase PAP2 family protein [Prevotella sp.]
MRYSKKIIIAARVMSLVFTPFYLPTVGLLALFSFSYLSLLPFMYKTVVVGIVYFFTILLPTLLIHIYRRHQRLTLIELGQRERRMVPYVLSILSYFTCVYIMREMHIPHFMSSIVIAALGIQIVCGIVNAWWKISTHTAAIGGVVGALFAFAAIFGFNPVPWLCITILLAGMLGTSRMVLRQHSLGEVVAGFVVGVVVGMTLLII